MTTPSPQSPPGLEEMRKGWDKACRAWSRDDCKDVIVTMKLGEAMMYAATDLIVTQDDRLSQAEAERDALDALRAPVEGEEIADFIRDQVCCPRIHGCEVNGADECPAERVRGAIRAAALSGPVEGAGEPVAWRVKDYTDGWVLCRTESYARRLSQDLGGLMEPLYPALRALVGLPSEEELISMVEEAMWSPASGPVNWTAEKIAAMKAQATRLARTILARLGGRESEGWRPISELPATGWALLWPVHDDEVPEVWAAAQYHEAMRRGPAPGWTHLSEAARRVTLWAPVLAPPALSPTGREEGASTDQLCSDCPPLGYSTDATRCLSCPRRAPAGGQEAGL